MAQEMSESKKQFIDYMLEIRQQNELAEAKEKINMKVDGLNKELKDIFDRAYQAAISEKVGEYQERANAEGLTLDEVEALNLERKDFEANPEKYGIVRDKCPIIDEADQRRALEILDLLKDTSKLTNNDNLDFDKMIQGFGERNQTKQPDWMIGKQESQ
jgi:hypothetical protein